MEAERGNHQKLIKEFGKLEQRLERAQSELAKCSRAAPEAMSTSATSSLDKEPGELEGLVEEGDVRAAVGGRDV